MRGGQGGVAAVFVVAVAVANLDAVGADALLTPLAVLGADLAGCTGGCSAPPTRPPSRLRAHARRRYSTEYTAEYYTILCTVHTLLDDFRANALVRLARLELLGAVVERVVAGWHHERIADIAPQGTRTFY